MICHDLPFVLYVFEGLLKREIDRENESLYDEMCCSASLFLYFTLMMMTFSSCNIISNSSQELETMPLFFPLDYSSKSLRFSWASSSSSSLFHTEKVTRQPDYFLYPNYFQVVSLSFSLKTDVVFFAFLFLFRPRLFVVVFFFFHTCIHHEGDLFISYVCNL